MEIRKLSCKLEKFNQEKLEEYLLEMNMNIDNYLLAYTVKTIAIKHDMGLLRDFFTRYAVVCFSEDDLQIFVFSMLNYRKVIEFVKINRAEIKKIKLKLPGGLASCPLTLKTNRGNINLSVPTNWSKFSKQNYALNRFNDIYAEEINKVI